MRSVVARFAQFLLQPFWRLAGTQFVEKLSTSAQCLIPSKFQPATRYVIRSELSMNNFVS